MERRLLDIEKILREAEGLYLSGTCFEALQILQGTKGSIEGGDQLQRAHYRRLLADILAELGRYEEARSEVTVAYDLLRGGVISLELARVQRTRGWVQLNLGEVSEAERCYHDAIGTLRCIEVREDVSRDMAACLNGLAFVCYISSSWSQAVKHLRDGLEICEDIQNKAFFMRNLGDVYLELGDWPRAEACLKESLSIFESRADILGMCQSYLSLGQLAARRGQKGRAQSLLERAQSISQKEGYRRELALSLEALGERALIDGKFDEALAYFTESLELGEEVAPNSNVVGGVLRRLGEVYVALGRLEDAELACGRTLEVAKRLGDRFQEAVVNRVMGLICQQKGEVRAARHHFERCIEGLAEIGERYERAKTLLLFGRLLLSNVSGERDFGFSRLEEARRLFCDLECRYHEATALVETVRWRLELDIQQDRSSLDQAKELFLAADEPEGLGVIGELEEELNRRLTRSISRARDEHELLKQLEESELQDLDGPLGEMARQLGARGALIALRLEDQAPCEVTGRHRIDEEMARRLVRAALPTVEGQGEMPIQIHGDAILRNFPFLAEKPIDTLLIIPFGEDMDGLLLYIDGDVSESSIAFAGLWAHNVGERLKKLRLNIIGKSREMVRVLEKILTVKDSSITVLIEGESGTGKELVARAIHFAGARKGYPFVPVDCGAVPGRLFESELFGHKRGAFTGANVSRIGLFEEANGGTLFLDEIANLDLHLQASLLRVLEDGTFRRVGENKIRKMNARVIAATNRRLEDEVANGRFRDDLYYRLMGFRIFLPPIRKRVEDIPLLAKHFLKVCAEDCVKDIPEISPEAIEYLCFLPWPGNVRQLRNAINKAVLEAEDGKPLAPQLFFGESPSGSRWEEEQGSLRERVEYFEREQLKRALNERHWNTAEAASSLGVSQRTVQKKVVKYGLKPTKRSS